MKKKSLILSALMALAFMLGAGAQTPADSLAFVAADWNWQDLGKGARAGYAQIKMFDSVQSISVVCYPARKYRTAIIHSPEEKCAPTDEIANRYKAKIAANGSYFNVKKLIPTTFFCQKHKLIAESDSKELYRSNGVVARRRRCSKDIEIFYYDAKETGNYCKNYYEALASGPVLVLGGESPSFPMEKSFYYLRHPRTFVGTADGMIYYVVIDGRFPGQGDGASIPETAAIARYLGCTDALNLDGGGSSTVWTEKTGVINHPYDNHKFDHEGLRSVPNILIAK